MFRCTQRAAAVAQRVQRSSISAQARRLIASHAEALPQPQPPSRAAAKLLCFLGVTGSLYSHFGKLVC
jgi:hypothetical protein